MKEIKAIFREKITRTETVESFRFQPEEHIDFSPGQFLQLLFDEHNKNNRLLNKYLSFSSAPQKEYIEVTKRISQSDFSQRLQALKKGEAILLKAPMGNCIFQDEYQKIGFLIGGIGITPVISIIEYILEKRLATNICLIYSNRFENDIAFKPQLDAWQKSYPHLLHILYTVSECESKDTRCIRGIIDQELVKSHMADWSERIIFVFGPPAMVTAMKEICFSLPCKPEFLKTENFLGY